ncbi:hypothetical protein [Microbacterium sp. Leaf159]|uniref:hypothetical protein n=1 Tax=Microbacterium sp. Leaf159 TaxID=1736279 RepID=UPI0012F809D2|nr:hypothetical protein [Microbacterium sp. Leaf159]
MGAAPTRPLDPAHHFSFDSRRLRPSRRSARPGPVVKVKVAPWGRSLSGRGLAGSLFAAPAHERLDAAHALHAEGLAVHVDLIVRQDGTHRGVTPAQVRAVRSELPHASIDLHLIVEGDPRDSHTHAAIEEAIHMGLDLGVERISLSRELLDCYHSALQDARQRGLAVWCELPHDAPADPVAGADGLLIMLIRPGTTEAADPAGLTTVRALAGRVPVGVDGGVTETLARECADLGASPIISGRALLTTS